MLTGRCWYILDLKDIAVPEDCLRLTQAPEAHLVCAELGREPGNAVTHGVQVTKNSLVLQSLQQQLGCRANIEILAKMNAYVSNFLRCL